MKKLIKIFVAFVMVFGVLNFDQVEAKYNTTPRAAKDISLGQTYTRILTRDNTFDDHYLKFTTPANGYITIKASRPVDTQGKEIGFYFELYNHDASIKALDTSTMNYNPLKEYFEYGVGLSQGTYYLNINPRGYVSEGAVAFTYNISFTASEYTEREPNNGITTATEITYNQDYTGFFNDGDDYYKIYSSSRKKAYFWLDSKTFSNLESSLNRFMFTDGLGEESSIWFGSSLTTWKSASGGKFYYSEIMLQPGYNYININATGDVSIPYKFKVVEEGRADGWAKQGSSWYYYKDNVPATGWLSSGGNWFYMNDKGVMQTGWTKVGNDWYYLNNAGVMQKGWLKSGSSWYYFNNAGVMQTGWTKVGSSWYYMNSAGAMQTRWQEIGGSWYYFDGSGAMQKGWLKSGNNWFYMNSSGAMQTGWLKQGGAWYYLNNSGHMLTGNHRIDNKDYDFDSSGKLR